MHIKFRHCKELPLVATKQSKRMLWLDSRLRGNDIKGGYIEFLNVIPAKAGILTYNIGEWQ